MKGLTSVFRDLSKASQGGTAGDVNSCRRCNVTGSHIWEIAEYNILYKILDSLTLTKLVNFECVLLSAYTHSRK